MKVKITIEDRDECNVTLDYEEVVELHKQLSAIIGLREVKEIRVPANADINLEALRKSLGEAETILERCPNSDPNHACTSCPQFRSHI